MKTVCARALCLLLAAVLVFSFMIPAVASSYNGNETVYVTTYGEKYHRHSCQYLSDSKHATTLQSAHDRGYDACSRCDPPGLRGNPPATPTMTPTPITGESNQPLAWWQIALWVVTLILFTWPVLLVVLAVLVVVFKDILKKIRDSGYTHLPNAKAEVLAKEAETPAQPELTPEERRKAERIAALEQVFRNARDTYGENIISQTEADLETEDGRERLERVFRPLTEQTKSVDDL